MEWNDGATKKQEKDFGCKGVVALGLRRSHSLRKAE